jgi:hypothetical protein
MRWTVQRFPGLERQIRDLAEQHREFRDEPLHLAIADQPGRDLNDIFLFELLGNFGGNEVTSDARLFEVTFESSPSFAMEADQKLHLVLSNPEEFRVALDQQWPTAEEIRTAVHGGNFEVLHTDKIGRKALELLNERASSVAATGSKRQTKRRASP